MSRYSGEGSCEGCEEKFRFFLIDTSLNDARFGYCTDCGMTSLLTSGAGAPGALEAAAEDQVDPCSCGGRFRGSASPRCPACKVELCSEAARVWIEGNIRKKRKDWSWQGSWQGRYCIVIENRLITDS